MMNKPNIAFFGTSEFSLFVLETLKSEGILPNLIVTMPDRPQGRKLLLTPSLVKIWADKNNIQTMQPDKIRTPEFENELKKIGNWDLFVVASYGKIIPENILYLPSNKTLNVHPSLLPLLRGAAPLERSILGDMQNTGVTIMRLDKDMDHGPIISQKEVVIEPWPIDRLELEEKLGVLGGEMLAEVIPGWISGKVKEVEQEHNKATHAPKVTKEEALLDLKDSPRKNLLKIKAFAGWPKAYFFDDIETGDGKNKVRIIVTNAEIQNDQLILKTVIPEGKKEMTWSEYSRKK
jgi:methionyl-tRNA formyltransferase